jgi:hypothetical protein
LPNIVTPSTTPTMSAVAAAQMSFRLFDILEIEP